MSYLNQQNTNGNAGELRTGGILAPQFWVMVRKPDVDGADYLVQNPCKSLEEIRDFDSSLDVFGIVQSKFFEGNNQVKVAKSYVLDNGKPRPEFFCCLHTDDSKLNPVNYFFTAKEISTEFEETSCGMYYYFSLTQSRDYSDFRDLDRIVIIEKIRGGMKEASANNNKRFLAKLFGAYSSPTRHYDSSPSFVYKFRVLDGVRVVIVENARTHESRLLEMRRDLYQNDGDYYWGEDDLIGGKFLAVNLLAHHGNGDIKNGLYVYSLYLNCIKTLAADEEYDISTSQLIEYAKKKPDFVALKEGIAEQTGVDVSNIVEITGATAVFVNGVDSVKMECVDLYGGDYSLVLEDKGGGRFGAINRLIKIRDSTPCWDTRMVYTILGSSLFCISD